MSLTRSAFSRSHVRSFKSAAPFSSWRMISYQPKRKSKVHTVWAFGDGFEGAIGNGEKGEALSPTRLTELDKKLFVSVSCGWNFTLAVTRDHKLYSWGKWGAHLALPSHRGNVYLPQLSDVASNLGIVQIAAGRQHAAAVSADGEVFTWGNAQFGQTGSGSTEERFYPYRLETLRGERVASISVGLDHSCALSECGRVWSWGFNECGQLGLGSLDELTEMATEDDIEAPYVATPAELDTSGLKIAQVECGNDCTAFVTTDGELFTCGNGEYGLLGHGEIVDHIPFPQHVAGISGVQRLSVGGTHMAAIAEDGNVYTWGWGQCGQLGHGDADLKVLEPKMIPFFEGKEISDVKCGGGHTVCVSKVNQKVYVFGFGGQGRLGLGSTLDVFEPTEIGEFGGQRVMIGGNVVLFDCSLDHSVFVTEHTDYH